MTRHVMTSAIAVLMTLAIAVLLLAGCGMEAPAEPESQEGTNGTVSTFWAQTIDDRRIPCVGWKSGYGAGMSCDWSAR